MRIIDEGFEGTGYEETWVETVSGGNTLDEDSTTIPCLGSQCLKAVATSIAAPSAYAKKTFGDSNTIFARAYIYISENGLTGASEICNVLNILTSAANSAARLQLRNNAGTFQIRFIYYSNGAEVNSAGVNININTWYLIELKYDTNKMQWSWSLNGVVKGNGTLTGAIRIPNNIAVGISVSAYSGTGQTTLYTDSVVVDNYQPIPYIENTDPLVIEIPSTTVLFTNRLYIKEIRWVDATTAGHTVVIKNKNGRAFWASEAAGDNFIDSYLYEGWVEGLQVPTLASGKIYIQIG